MIVTMGAKANFGSTKPNQYPKFFLVDSKFGERNKIACRIIKLWNNLINQSLAKLTDQLNWSNFVLMMGCTRPRNDCLFGLCSVWSALRSCFKNKPWKQQRHAQKIYFLTDSDSKLFFYGKTLHSESASSFYQNSKCAAGWWPFFYKDTKNCHLFSVITATALVI